MAFTGIKGKGKTIGHIKRGLEWGGKIGIRGDRKRSKAKSKGARKKAC